MFVKWKVLWGSPDMSWMYDVIVWSIISHSLNLLAFDWRAGMTSFSVIERYSVTFKRKIESERTRNLKVGKGRAALRINVTSLSVWSAQPRSVWSSCRQQRYRSSWRIFTSCEELPDPLIQGCDIASSNLLMQKDYLTKRLDIFALRNLSYQFVFQKILSCYSAFKDMCCLGNNVHFCMRRVWNKLYVTVCNLKFELAELSH